MEDANKDIAKALQVLLSNKENPVVFNLNNVPQDPQKIAESAEQYISQISNLTPREMILRSLGKIETLRNITTIGISAVQKMQTAEYAYLKIAMQAVEEVEVMLLWLSSHSDEDDLFPWISKTIFGIEMSSNFDSIHQNEQIFEENIIDDDEL